MLEGVKFTVLSHFSKSALDAMFQAEITWILCVHLYFCQIIEWLLKCICRVNFKKNEKTYNAANSEVLKMVQEIDSEPKEPEPGRKEQIHVILL